jgi:hypothetical protein
MMPAIQKDSTPLVQLSEANCSTSLQSFPNFTRISFHAPFQNRWIHGLKAMTASELQEWVPWNVNKFQRWPPPFETLGKASENHRTTMGKP